MTYELYWGSGSPNAWRALLALEVKGLDYESRLIQFSKGEHKTPEYLAMNPRGKVPVLKDGDTVVYESLAILAYLDARHPEPPLFGATPAETGYVWQTVSELINYTIPPIFGLTVLFFRGRSGDEPDAVRERAAEVHAELPAIEQRLAGGGWLAGESISAADIALYPALACMRRGLGMKEAQEFDLGLMPLGGRYPELGAWAERIEALPGFDNTWPPHWRE